MLTQLVVWLNELANVVGGIVLAPVAWLPGWLSATVVAVVTGVLMLMIFKYTSDQAAIKRVRDQIKANLLGLSLFKDNMRVALRAQGRILRGAGRLMLLSLMPIAVMTIPMCLLLAQIALWYQARPLRTDEETIVTVHVPESSVALLSKVKLQPSTAYECTAGPVRVAAKQIVCWTIKATTPGRHHLTFHIDGSSFEKELAVGNGFARVSQQRPQWHWSSALLHPHEQPFPTDSPVQAIEVDYPSRASWTSGSNTWLVYWFVVSMVAAFAVRPLLGVNI